MANVIPFRPYRYTSKAGCLRDLVTQPYDKISPEMQARYLTASRHNVVRIILGETRLDDSASENVYTRAAAHLREWIARGIFAQDAEPAFYPYFQEFTVPDTGERVVRKGFIGLGPAVDYPAGIVHRHEQTLAGPKKDRLELLRHTRAQLEQLFLLYSDPACAIDSILDEAAREPPLADVTDEYQAIHRLWRIADPRKTAEISQLMAGRKLLIADGHHRYETALAFRRENPDLPAARQVMMTFVNMDSPGLRILATHRLVNGLNDLNTRDLLAKVGSAFRVTAVDGVEVLRHQLASAGAGTVRIGLALASSSSIYLLEADRGPGQLDVSLLHEALLSQILGISEEAVREQHYLRYVRGLDTALEEVRNGIAQMALLLNPVTVEQVAEVSFSGGVMPEKSTDFYPKLLSGLSVYRLDG